MNNDKPYTASSETLSDYFHCSVKPEAVPNGAETKIERGKLYSQTRDLLWSGQTFIKGNNYTLVSNTGADNEKEEETEGGLGIRYFEDYSTIRCRRCNALGHMSFTCPSANGCTRICIYCSSHNHDQFDCLYKMCFRCNKRGHKIQQCPERKVELCSRCNNPGHRENDCVIHPKEIKEENLKQAVCMTCGELGHILCKLKVPEILPWDKDNPNYDVGGDSAEMLSEKYKKRKEESENIQCCYCGGVHRPSRCTNKPEVNPQSSEAIRSRIRQRENDDNQYSHRRSSSRERRNHYRKHKASSRHSRRSRSRSHDRKHYDH